MPIEWGGSVGWGRGGKERAIIDGAFANQAV
jgi:hypothetical protein